MKRRIEVSSIATTKTIKIWRPIPDASDCLFRKKGLANCCYTSDHASEPKERRTRYIRATVYFPTKLKKDCACEVDLFHFVSGNQKGSFINFFAREKTLSRFRTKKKRIKNQWYCSVLLVLGDDHTVGATSLQSVVFTVLVLQYGTTNVQNNENKDTKKFFIHERINQTTIF